MSERTRPSSMDRVKQAAGQLGLEIDIRRMDQSTRTAGEAAAACGCEVAQIVKSLVFENAHGGALVLCLTSGINQVNTQYLSEALWNFSKAL